jgi:hypothetical protein
MARPLAELHPATPDRDGTSRDLRLTRRTGRSFAAAVAVLLLTTIVVNRSEAALSSHGAMGSALLTSGTVELTDDDQGRSLFDLRDLTPATPVRRCLEVAYGGTLLPVSLAVRAEAVGDLAGYLDVVIDEGDGGGFETCDAFVSHGRVFAGSLRELADGGWLELDRIVNSGERRSYRIELTVQDRQEALGLGTGLELAWEVTPS